jgi:hypothetical protein
VTPNPAKERVTQARPWIPTLGSHFFRSLSKSRMIRSSRRPRPRAAKSRAIVATINAPSPSRKSALAQVNTSPAGIVAALDNCAHIPNQLPATSAAASSRAEDSARARDRVTKAASPVCRSTMRRRARRASVQRSVCRPLAWWSRVGLQDWTKLGRVRGALWCHHIPLAHASQYAVLAECA